MSEFRLDSRLRLGPPNLVVRDLKKSLSYYERELGLKASLAKRASGQEVVELFAPKTKEPLLVLEHDPSAREPPYTSAGLYHFAMLVPDRKSLASTYLALGKLGLYFEGFADHLVSESVYLRDPEGNGIEIYADRPRESWRRESGGQIVMDTLPLDISSLLSELKSEERMNAKSFPTGAKIGHMHLKVTNLERSKKFYTEKLGLDMTSDWSAFGALFLSVGGYHHHIGMNVWESRGGASMDNQNRGLEHFTLVVPDANSIQDLASNLNLRESEELFFSDPDGIAIRALHE